VVGITARLSIEKRILLKLPNDGPNPQKRIWKQSPPHCTILMETREKRRTPKHGKFWPGTLMTWEQRRTVGEV